MKEIDLKILELLHKNETIYTSGQQISEELGISRTAVWKHINNLRENGYRIESRTNRGYKLIRTPDRIIAEEVKLGLDTHQIGSEILVFSVVDSTNTRAKELARQGYPTGTVIVAEEQNGGKGRRGRNWYSPPGTGLWFSIIVRPDITPDRAPFLTIIASLALVKAFEKYDRLSPEIKWPNDILICGKKVSGILSELSADLGNINFAVIGIGINVNLEDFPEELINKAASLKNLLGYKVDRNRLLGEVLIAFEEYYRKLTEEKFIELLDEWRNYLRIIGKEVVIYNASEEIVGKVTAVSPQGELVVRDKKGAIHTFWAGDVSLRKK